MVLDFLLLITAVAIAIALTLGKGLNINIVHTVKHETKVQPLEHNADEEPNEESVRKEIAGTLQELWGLTDEE